MSIKTRLTLLESRHHGQGVAAVEYAAGVWTHQGKVLSEQEVHKLDRAHAHLIIRGDSPPLAGCITIRRSYGV